MLSYALLGILTMAACVVVLKHQNSFREIQVCTPRNGLSRGQETREPLVATRRVQERECDGGSGRRWTVLFQARLAGQTGRIHSVSCPPASRQRC